MPRLTVTVDAEQYAYVESLAAEHDRSMAGVVRQFIDAHRDGTRQVGESRVDPGRVADLVARVEALEAAVDDESATPPRPSGDSGVDAPDESRWNADAPPQREHERTWDAPAAEERGWDTDASSAVGRDTSVPFDEPEPSWTSDKEEGDDA